MKKRITFLLSLMAMLFSFNTVNAETVSPYAVDFNTTIDVSQPEFKVAPGWRHIAGYSTSYYYGNTYMTYSYSSTIGVDGSGALEAGAQKTNKDYLISPKVSGTVSLDVNKRYSGGSIKFFKVNEAENGTLTIGDEITYLGTPDVVWSTLSFSLEEATRVAIMAEYAYLDNFQATSADVVLQAAVAFESVTCLSGTTVDVTADGTFPVSFRVTVKNNGERDLAAGEATLTLGMRTANSGDFQAEFTTVPVPQALAVGEVSDEIVVTANVPYANYPNRYQYGVRENLTGVISSTVQWIETVPYAPVLNVRYNGGNAESGLAVSYGMVSTDVTKEFTIQNQGAASMNVTAIDLPNGFTADVTAPFTLDAHSEQVVSVTLPASTPGIFSGDMVIKCEGLSDFTVALTGVVLDPTKWFADFNDEKMPAGSLFTNDWTTGYSTTYTPTAYYIQALKATTDMNLFITPLLHADAGEQMTFDVARRNTSTSEEYHLAVYYSTDRENWTLLRNILNTELSEEKASSSSWGSSYYKFSTFSVTLPEAGDYYIGFSAGYVLLDNVYGLTPVAVQHDVQYTFGDQPATGMANHDLTLTATAMNPLAEAETATLKFLVNGEVAVQSEAIELTQHAQKTITLTYTPYVAGTYQTKLVLELADGTQFESEAGELVVGEEVASALAAVGDKNATLTSQNVPLCTNYISSQAEMIYTADEINLPVGTKITGLTFKGYRSSAANTAPIQIWMEETSDNAATSAGTSFVEMSDETKVFDGDYEFQKAGSSSSFADMISITLPTPIIYNGGNLRVAAQSTNCNFSATYFQCYGSGAMYRRADKTLENLSTSSFQSTYKPVLYLGIEKAASTFSGVLTITDGEATEPCANTMVTLTSGNVKYMGTTDTEGAFNFNVLQDDKTYDITFDYTEKNYFPLAEADRTVTFNGQSVVKNINLTAAKDFFIDAFEVAQQGKVGRELTASVTATNYNKATMAANAYTAKLYVAGQVVAEAETVALEEMEQHTFNFTWTPTEAGNLEAYMELAVAGSTTRTTEVQTIDVEPKHNVVFENTIPEAAMVNTEFTATVKVKNTLREEEPEGSYVVKFFFGDEQVGEADGLKLAILNQAYTFALTPHEAGQFNAYAVVEFADGESFTSDAVAVTVNEEVASNMKEVIAATTFVRGAPINAYYKITQSEMIYTAEQLGLPAGTKLTSIAFKYYGSHSFPLNVYVANTTDEAPASTGATPVSTDGMTKVYSSEKVYISGGTQSNPATMVIEFTQPFTYDGTNLRIFVDQPKDTYSMTTYFGQNSNYQGQAVYRYSDSDVSSVWFSACALPALSVGYEKSEVTTFSGKLDIYNVDGSQPAVAGATLKLVSDNVEYKGVTDEDGMFSIPVIKDDRTYTVTVEPVPGLLFLPFEETVTFAGESIVKNLTLTQAEGLYIANIEPEAKAMVNYEFNVSFEGTNYEATTQSDYAVQLYVNDELVAEAEPVALASGESHIFNLSYTPHVAGPATAHISMGDYDSDDFRFTVSDEVAMKEVQLGAATTTSNFVPFYWSFADNATGAFGDFYYTPALLEESGIMAGSKIYSITYTGRNTYDNGITKLTATAWVGLEAADAEWNAGETEGLTEVSIYDNESVELDENVETAIELPEPIVYDGTSRLRVSTFINANGKFATVQYDVDERGSETSCYGYGSNKNLGSGKGVPVATVLIGTENHLTGRITNGNNPVADAVVTLVCGDIIYTAETDADGNYDVTVLQNDKEYEMIVESETLGEAVAGTVSFADGNQVKDFDFNATSIVEVISRSKLNANAPMYNVSGQRVDASYKGIILQNGMKFRMK